jgi:single-strand DNA-binding protein
VFIEGHLRYDTWDDKNGGGKRSALKVVVENFQYLEPRQDGQGSSYTGPRAAAQPARAAVGARTNGAPTGFEDEEPGMGAPPSRAGGVGGNEDDIPF